MARSTHTLFFFVLATALLISSLSFGHAEAAPTPISFGQTMTESISIQGEQDSFTFMGATGDVILVRVTTETVLWPQLDLYDPEGSLLESALEVGPCVVEINSSPLPTDGYYQLRISDYIGTGTGTYWVFVQRLNNPGGATQMEFGSTLSATITILPLGQESLWFLMKSFRISTDSSVKSVFVISPKFHQTLS